MKIEDGKGVQGPRVDPTGSSRPAAKGAVRGAEAGAPAGDQVSVSDTARHLAQLRVQVGDPHAVRQDRVASLQSVMAKGQYSADIGDVAEKFLREKLGEILA
jgi:flagellar biosynthesis anti-sigma factor FlgM